MRATRRLATLTLAATAGLGLAACSTTVHPSVTSSPMTQHISVAGRTGAAHTSAAGTPGPATTEGTPTGTSTPPDASPPAADTAAPGTGGDGVPEPGYGIHGDEGLCQAEAGWYGYAGLALAGAGADGAHVYPDDVVPFLEQLRDAPTAHEDASPELVSAASDLSYATDEVISEITSGADAAQAMAELDDPFTAFADGCIAAGIQV
jgi:hypothetical protein